MKPGETGSAAAQAGCCLPLAALRDSGGPNAARLTALQGRSRGERRARARCLRELLLAQSPGQVLTTLPGVAATRAGAFAVHALPIERFATAEHLYSSTGLAPARYESATIRRARAISRTAPGERRDALMSIAWGLSQHCGAFRERDRELRGRGMRPIEARVALARHACRLCHRMLQTQQPFEEERYSRARHRRGR